MIKNIHILGSGSIGFIIGKALSYSKISSTYLIKDSKPKFSSFQINGSTFETNSEYINESNDAISHLFISTKAYDTVPAIRSVFHRLSLNSVIILVSNSSLFLFNVRVPKVQNGLLGVQDELQKSFTELPKLVFSSTTLGGYKSKDLVVNQTGCSGLSYFNIKNADCRTRELLIGLKCLNPVLFDGNSILEDLKFRNLLIQKLHINSCINPLTTISNCLNGELLNNERNAKLIIELTKENEKIFKLYFAGKENGLNEVQNKELEDIFTFKNLSNAVYSTLNVTKNNKSSMLQDFLKMKKTEIDYLNLYIVKLGIRVGIDAKNNKLVYEMFREKEGQSLRK
ncbi:2-dehydropantoate 2-reductase (Ketopantoate reductase) (KPA reductase) (KPR) [Lobulomyces angularis]|nr:2-dehydropantoate 2-reductase (Ketopantoate reductase) (KPA reductase) (KPR) [Lobulomyces angularis]